MKFKTTSKEIKNYYNTIISIGYCGAQHLLQYQEARAYNCGVYGWNYDLYIVDGVALCTGYRSMPGKSVNYDLLNEYEKAAEKIVYNYSIGYEKQKELVNGLLAEFIEKATA